MAIYRNQDYTLIGTGDGERVRGYMISADFSSTLGVQPLWSRAFRPDDDQPGAPPVVILGGGFWKRKFGSSLEIVGKALVLNGTSYTVVGVIPEASQVPLIPLVGGPEIDLADCSRFLRFGCCSSARMLRFVVLCPPPTPDRAKRGVLV